MKIKSRVELGVIRTCRKQDLDRSRPLGQQRVCLYTRRAPRRLLGRHPDRASAVKQERVIQMRKHGR